MELTTQQQTAAFLWAFVLGLMIGLFYLLFSLIFNSASETRIGVFIRDTLFMFTVFVINFLYSVAMTEGKIRFYVVFSELLSFLLFYFTLGKTIYRIFLTFSNWFFSKAEKIMRKFGKKCFERISKRLKLLIFNKRRKKI